MDDYRLFEVRLTNDEIEILLKLLCLQRVTLKRGEVWQTDETKPQFQSEQDCINTMIDQFSDSTNNQNSTERE